MVIAGGRYISYTLVSYVCFLILFLIYPFGVTRDCFFGMVIFSTYLSYHRGISIFHAYRPPFLHPNF